MQRECFLFKFVFFFYNVLDTRVVWKAFMNLPYITGDFKTKLYKKNGQAKIKPPTWFI